jgi:hypothetical protein
MSDGEKSQGVKLRRRAFVAAALSSLAACGGGGSADSAAEPTPPVGSNPPVAGPPPANSPPAAGSALPPPPAPAPEPPPAPEAPSVSVDPRITLQELDLNNLVVFKGYHQEGRYERYRRLQMLEGDSASIEFQGFSLGSGGTREPLKGSRYTLLVDGREAAVCEVTSGTREASFALALSGIAAGWHKFDIGGLTGGETSPSWFMFVKKGALPAPDTVPVVRSTHELAFRRDRMHAFAIAPARFAPTPRPLARREVVPFSDPLVRADMHCSQWVPVRVGDIHRPNRNAAGVMSAFDVQAYFWSSVTRLKPPVPLLDGPRGVGTVSFVTHIEIGKAAPGGRPRNNLYVVDPWRVCKVSEDGTIKTLVGYRHAGMASYWEEPADVELVGDWSAVPEARRGFHELWGMAWDERTLTINDTAAPIPSENNERPHITGPVMFVSDTQNNRICKIEFSATSHAAAPKVTEFVTDSADAWDVVYSEGAIYVSERKAHRIAAYDARTGAYLRTVVSGAALANVDASRFVKRTASLADIQAQPCVAPEGLYKLPGDPWLYFGSVAMQQVRRVHLGTGEVQVMCDVPPDVNSTFFKIAVSDGSFGPRGTIFVSTWSATQGGFPYTWLPEDGPRFTRWSGPSRHWSWYDFPVGTGQWNNFIYSMAPAVGQGRLVVGGAGEGLLVISRRNAGDPSSNTSIDRGSREFRNRGLHLLHGQNGFGFFGEPLPWGVSADLDNFLAFHGHTRM